MVKEFSVKMEDLLKLVKQLLLNNSCVKSTPVIEICENFLCKSLFLYFLSLRLT